MEDGVSGDPGTFARPLSLPIAVRPEESISRKTEET